MGRTTIEFNQGADAELGYLANTLGVKSKAEVVRNALSLYAYLVQLLDKPDRALGIIAEDQGNRIEKVIVVPGLQRRIAAPAEQSAREQVPLVTG
jgi:hypothetical protein